VIIASALKHIDRCEYEVREAHLTNCQGVGNVLDAVNKNGGTEKVVFISTDKACSPINTYGITKALAEKLVIENAYKMKHTKCVIVRYGNILNSRGSIIPILHNLGSKDVPYVLTHEDMTRFLMTQEQSVQLINYAILKGESGDIVIPKLAAMRIKDLMEIFGEKYNKPVVLGSVRPGEKLAESLINDNEVLRTNERNLYYVIKPDYNMGTLNFQNDLDFTTYNSAQDVLSKEDLKDYLLMNKFL